MWARRVYLESAVANATFEPIATLPVGSTSFIDDHAAGATLYEYMIVAATAANVPAVSQIVYAASRPPCRRI